MDHHTAKTRMISICSKKCEYLKDTALSKKKKSTNFTYTKFTNRKFSFMAREGKQVLGCFMSEEGCIYCYQEFNNQQEDPEWPLFP